MTMKFHYKVAIVLWTLCTLVAKSWQDESKQLLSLTASTSEFSQHLYNVISAYYHNLIFSPYSIHSAMTMVSGGARGNTLHEMRNALGILVLADDAGSTYRDLIDKLNDTEGVKLSTANALFVQPELKLDTKFSDEVSLDYSAEVNNLDFQAEGGAEKHVNDYVAEKTENMIKNVIAQGSIDASTSMLIVNTIFFNGRWLIPFKEHKTKKEEFFQLRGKTKEVDMMNNEVWLRYKQDEDRKADILEIPYRGNRFSFYIVLPHDREGLADVERMLTRYGIDRTFKNLESTNLGVKLPKFKIETRLPLAARLTSMGMRKLFDPKGADLSGIGSLEKGNLYVDQVVHQAVIDITEVGTVAAAATVNFVAAALEIDEPPTTTFTADHPFLFFLRDSKTEVILFRGKFSG